MPSRAPCAKSEGCGADCRRHRLPSQDSMKYAAAWSGVYSPVATHALAEVHDTPLSATSLELREISAGFGVGSTRQVLPFHLSASVGPPGWLKSVPVAVHALAEVQDTASNTPAVAWYGNGTACTRQLVPFQESASGRAFPVALFQPTAVQARAR